MEIENKIPQELIEIIMKHSSFERDEINNETSLNLDYRGAMSHYDAILFFNDLYDTYNISFPKDFDVTTYFEKEGMELPHILKKVFGLHHNTNKSKKSITIEHILKVINKKEWIDL